MYRRPRGQEAKRPRGQETKRPKGQEAKRPRGQEAKNHKLVFPRKYDIYKFLLKILAMIEHDQEKIGNAVSGQSKT